MWALQPGAAFLPLAVAISASAAASGVLSSLLLTLLFFAVVFYSLNVTAKGFFMCHYDGA
ncbi:TPA: hypothetical protein ACGQ50_000818 [Enterobacter cloacae]